MGTYLRVLEEIKKSQQHGKELLATEELLIKRSVEAAKKCYEQMIKEIEEYERNELIKINEKENEIIRIKVIE